MDYGIKISKPGYDVKTATPQQLVFSSKYQTLKIHTQGSGTIRHSTGRRVQIYHGLGYVPAYIVHSQADPFIASIYGDPSDYFIHPVYPAIGGCHVDRSVMTWIDNNYLYIEANGDVGWQYFYTGLNQYNYAYQSTVLGFYNGSMYIGNTSSYGIEDGAYRFTNINLNRGQNIYQADLGIAIAYTTGSGRIFGRIYGIAEDNTGSFTGSPFGRPKTSNYHDFEIGSGRNAGDVVAIGVTGALQEIINRSGWSNGNSAGFLLFNNGSDYENEIGDNYYNGNVYCSYAYLRVMTSDVLVNYKYTIFKNKIV